MKIKRKEEVEVVHISSIELRSALFIFKQRSVEIKLNTLIKNFEAWR